MVHGGVPGGGGDAAEEVSGALVPRPPEVHRQLLEGDQLRGEGGADGEAAEGLHRARPYRPSRRHGQGSAPRATRRSSASARSEEHTSELQSLMRISYAVFCLKKKKEEKKNQH